MILHHPPADLRNLNARSHDDLSPLLHHPPRLQINEIASRAARLFRLSLLQSIASWTTRPLDLLGILPLGTLQGPACPFPEREEKKRRDSLRRKAPRYKLYLDAGPSRLLADHHFSSPSRLGFVRRRSYCCKPSRLFHLHFPTPPPSRWHLVRRYFLPRYQILGRIANSLNWPCLEQRLSLGMEIAGLHWGLHIVFLTLSLLTCAIVPLTRYEILSCAACSDG